MSGLALGMTQTFTVADVKHYKHYKCRSWGFTIAVDGVAGGAVAVQQESCGSMCSRQAAGLLKNKQTMNQIAIATFLCHLSNH